MIQRAVKCYGPFLQRSWNGEGTVIFGADALFLHTADGIAIGLDTA